MKQERGKRKTKQKKLPWKNQQPKRKCVCCGSYIATLQISDKEWICEDCAQYMSDAGHELSLND